MGGDVMGNGGGGGEPVITAQTGGWGREREREKQNEKEKEKHKIYINPTDIPCVRPTRMLWGARHGVSGVQCKQDGWDSFLIQ